MTKEMTYDKWLFFVLCQNNHIIKMYVTDFQFVNPAPYVNYTWSFFILSLFLLRTEKTLSEA